MQPGAKLNFYGASKAARIKIHFCSPRLLLSARSIRSEPKPFRSGGSTSGPPISCQQNLIRSVSQARSHATRTCPHPLDKAPYLIAFVASSCNAMASRDDFCASSQIPSGPSIRNRSRWLFGKVPGSVNRAVQRCLLPVVGCQQVMCARKSLQPRKECVALSAGCAAQGLHSYRLDSGQRILNAMLDLIHQKLLFSLRSPAISNVSGNL